MFRNILLMLSGVFYSVLCIFSLVTGIIYMTGKRKLNPLELSDKTVRRLNESGKMEEFARRMGLITFIVGIIQGLSAYCLFLGRSPIHYWIAFGFNAFSIMSALMKLKQRLTSFPIIKLVFYLSIMIILLLKVSRNIYFS